MNLRSHLSRWCSRNRVLGALAGLLVGSACAILFAFGLQDGIFDPEWWEMVRFVLPGIVLTGWLVGDMSEWGEGVACLAAPLILSIQILIFQFGNPWAVMDICVLGFPACLCGFFTGGLARVLRYFLSSKSVVQKAR